VRARSLVLAALAALILVVPATAQAKQSRTVWLCRPGLAHNPCATSLTATVDRGNGNRSVERSKPAAHPKIDCFYVYPTVSGQSRAAATRHVDPEERAAATMQASRFSQVCRIFAPMYRQITVAALLGQKKPTRAQQETAHRDVRNAWRDYLAHDNHGRGVVLIGHSQGTYQLSRLIIEDVESRPSVLKRLVSAILLGGNIQVPVGKDVGGTFTKVPACRAPTQVGCVIAYSSFVQPPPADALFGLPTSTSLQVLCTNPASLAGGRAPLFPSFGTRAFPGPLGPFVNPIPEAPTPWVSEPDLYTGQCRYEFGRSWLDIGDIGRIDGRLRVAQRLGPRWGLHLADVNIAVGNLVDLVRSQTAAYRR
jgi:hypothetical protein